MDKKIVIKAKNKATAIEKAKKELGEKLNISNNYIEDENLDLISVDENKGLFGVFKKENTYNFLYNDPKETSKLEAEIEDLEYDIKIDGEFEIKLDDEGVKLKVKPPGKSGDSVKYSQIKEKLDSLKIVEVNWEEVQNELNEPSEKWKIIAPRKPELDQDAEIEFDISQDKLEAFISYKPAIGGRSFNFDEIRKEAEKSGIKYGLKEEKLKSIINNNETVDDILIASGQEPVSGEDAKLIYHFVTEKNNVGTKRDDGSIDFYDLGQIANVKPGDVLVTKEDSKPGESGRSVLGEEIPAPQPKDCELPSGKNVEKNNNKLLAEIEGQAVRDGKRVHVLPIHEVNGDVDLSVGNIDFIGNVLIKGDVKEGFKVKAEGNIEVKGRVSAANLIAGNEVIIHSGFIGKDKAEIKANGDIKVKFVENGKINSKSNIYIAEAAMHSKLIAGQSIFVKEGKGLLVGGETRASSKIEANVIGSSLATKTILEVGIDPELKEEMRNIKEQIEEAKGNILKSNKAIKMLDKLKKSHGELPKDKELMYYRLKKTEKNLNKTIEKKNNRLVELEKKFEKTSKGKITVNKSIYPGSKLIIGKAQYNVQDEMRVSTFVEDKGEVRQIPL
ncbi:MAG: DUF342 domain-containing protein [Bacillota bacterium]